MNSLEGVQCAFLLVEYILIRVLIGQYQTLHRLEVDGNIALSAALFTIETKH